MEDAAGERVAAFLDRELSVDLAAVGVVGVDELEQVKGLRDASVFGERTSERCRVAGALGDAQDLRGAHGFGGE